MTQQPLTDQQLDDIEQRAAHLHEYVAADIEGAQPDFDKLTGEDVPVLLAEIRRQRTTPPMVCINCETPVGWVDCPTGGWWAHETHPADGHDAAPRPARQDEHVAENTLPAWLYQRFAVIHGAPPWDRIDEGEHTYWEHHAAAVRRAVDRGGFKDTAAGGGR